MGNAEYMGVEGLQLVSRLLFVWSADETYPIVLLTQVFHEFPTTDRHRRRDGDPKCSTCISTCVEETSTEHTIDISHYLSREENQRTVTTHTNSYQRSEDRCIGATMQWFHIHSVTHRSRAQIRRSCRSRWRPCCHRLPSSVLVTRI